ncbi:TPA: hypothetical protein ACM2WJ_002045 [Klebsiella pneumoniae]|uniref:hypothetical protein n=1 Tax=Klebsiella pneumoniae TaxID=573 RepID=UPI000A5E7BA1|nr:hypothetical protein [Klebsiella pneumoniae]MCA5497499.1 hypothetical protein [Klebsiella pneumoniae]MCA5508278.1 hypothetical protein [Klebsiella pneumoniae]MCE7395570.1 hypothetical protein [Klebsiella pneumoniae]MCQ0510503.1 hypothetical protein [Klebsiella pneumoniae]MCQ1491260.1 hypothetical protein [Klebsiella pneumoniae]
MKTFQLAMGFAVTVALYGCAAVQYNDGEKVSIQSDAWYGLDSLHGTAVKACQQYGKSKAVYLHSANMNPNLPKGSGVQNTIWKCEP